MVPFLKKYPWCTVLRLLLSLQQQLLPQVSPTQQQHQPIRFAPFKSFLSWIPELWISTSLGNALATVAMAIAKKKKNDTCCFYHTHRCLFRARTLANSSCVVLHYFSRFVLHVLALFWYQYILPHLHVLVTSASKNTRVGSFPCVYWVSLGKRAEGEFHTLRHWLKWESAWRALTKTASHWQ